jgi:hypothetical protein
MVGRINKRHDRSKDMDTIKEMGTIIDSFNLRKTELMPPIIANTVKIITITTKYSNIHMYTYLCVYVHIGVYMSICIYI